MQRKISVTISESTAQKIDVMKIDLPKISSMLIEWYVKEFERDIGTEYMMDHIRKHIREKEKEIKAIEAQYDTIKAIKTEINRFKLQYNALLSVQRDTDRKVELQSLIAYLNRRIIAYNYDIREVMAKQRDIIDKITEIDKEFNIHTHIKKVRLLREKSFF